MTQRHYNRARLAYEMFRGGFVHSEPPHWDDLPQWMRDALLAAYLQGKLDAPRNHDEAPRFVAGKQCTHGVLHSDHCKECARNGRYDNAGWPER